MRPPSEVFDWVPPRLLWKSVKGLYLHIGKIQLIVNLSLTTILGINDLEGWAVGRMHSTHTEGVRSALPTLFLQTMNSYTRVLSSRSPRRDKDCRSSGYSATLRGVRRKNCGSAEDTFFTLAIVDFVFQ